MRSANFTWCTLCLCILLHATTSRAVLTQGEKDALVGILGAFPNLASIPTSEISRDSGNDYGHSWTNNYDDLCNNGDGYEYYGLYCEGGDISGIVLYVPRVGTIKVTKRILMMIANRLNNTCQLVDLDRTQAWYITPGLSTNFSFVSGLTFLKNVYVEDRVSF